MGSSPSTRSVTIILFALLIASPVLSQPPQIASTTVVTSGAHTSTLPITSDTDYPASHTTQLYGSLITTLSPSPFPSSRSSTSTSTFNLSDWFHGTSSSATNPHTLSTNANWNGINQTGPAPYVNYTATDVEIAVGSVVSALILGVSVWWCRRRRGRGPAGPGKAAYVMPQSVELARQEVRRQWQRPGTTTTAAAAMTGAGGGATAVTAAAAAHIDDGCDDPPPPYSEAPPLGAGLSAVSVASAAGPGVVAESASTTQLLPAAERPGSEV